MRAILPGRPQSRRQAISTAHWDELRLVAYISGNAAVIATGPHAILQTLYIDSANPLRAITIEESSGRIAICDDHSVYIYDPVGRDDGFLRWQEVHEHTDNDVLITSLSWASPEEVLLGGSRLRLWYLPDTESSRFIWDQHVPYSTAMAYCSPDGGLIASCGLHDRMVKIWRRLSYEIDSTRFDVSYLPHPTSVTSIHWRKPWHTEQNLDNLLYTFCADSRLRVWSHSDHHSTAVMQHIAEIDMCNIIQPRRLSVGSMSRRRYAFIIDSRDFSTATEKAVQAAPTNASDHALEHLIAIANRSPEICIVLDGLGHMSAWGLENAGCKNKTATEVFNIAHIGDLNVQITQRPDRLEDYTQFCIFAGGSTESSLSILVHSFDGSISWYDAQITHLFDTAPRHERVRLLTSWAGHDDPVKGIVRSQDGKLLCSWTEDNDVIVWRVKIHEDTTSLLLQQSISFDVDIIDATFIGENLMLLREDCLHVFPSDTKYPLKDQARPQQISKLATNNTAGVFYDDYINAYNVSTGEYLTKLQISPDSNDSILCSAIEFPGQRQDVITVASNGLISGLASTTKGELSLIASYPTAVFNAVHVSAYGGKVALVDEGGHLSIWDSVCGSCEARIEISEHKETVGCLEWHTTSNGNLMLAVACTFKIIIFSQERYGDEASWISLYEVRMREHTSHSVGCLRFLTDGSLVVGAGNQLFIPENTIVANNELARVVRQRFDAQAENRKRLPPVPSTHIVDALNSTLPIYHPRLLHLLMDSDQLDLALTILCSLHEQLKFFSEGDVLPSTLSFSMSALVHYAATQELEDGMRQLQINENGTQTKGQDLKFADIIERLKENIEKQRVSYLSDEEMSNLVKTVDIIGKLENIRTSVDEHALLYLQGLYISGETGVPWRSIMYASLSNSQEVLVDLVTHYYGGKLTWDAARKSGLFMWLSEPDSVRTQMENVGRAEYTKHEDRNPVDCSLYYLALDKKNILQGLWRTSIGIKEKANTMKLLANNFNEPRWKSTALKNAYALLSKRRFEYAAAFFLLAGSLKDAVNACVHQIKDLQLAIAIARVYSDDGVVLKQLIEKEFLPAASRSLEGRWMATWACEIMLKQPQKAVQAMVRPLHDVLGVEPTRETLDYRINDVLLSRMYTELRVRTPGAVSPREEYVFVRRCATYLRRMGCDFLALSMVRSWEFLPPSSEPQGVLEEGGAKTDDVASATAQVETVKAEKKKPPPTQFVEPTADSLLDSFGF